MRYVLKQVREDLYVIRSWGTYTESSRPSFNEARIGDLNHSLSDLALPTRVHVLMEYAESDLTEYYAAFDPPAITSDIIAFWRQLSSVAMALESIHHFSVCYPGYVKGYHGYFDTCMIYLRLITTASMPM